MLEKGLDNYGYYNNKEIREDQKSPKSFWVDQINEQTFKEF